jgi:hypothetical protein
LPYLRRIVFSGDRTAARARAARQRATTVRRRGAEPSSRARRHDGVLSLGGRAASALHSADARRRAPRLNPTILTGKKEEASMMHRRTRYLLIASCAAGCSAAYGPDQHQISAVVSNPNYAEYFAYGGFITTDLAFSEFYGSNFTLMAWVLPQYVFNGPGTVFTDATGTFSVGQGNYRSGDGGDKKLGSSVLTVKVGAQTANYLAPDYRKLVWNSLALVRTVRSGSTMFVLYLNGAQLTPFVKAADGTISTGSDISFAPGASVPMPNGTLMMGRNTASQSSANQFYGFIDEACVINRALAASATFARAQTPPTGTETDLVAGWVFDPDVSFSLPPKLARPITTTGAATGLPVAGHTAAGGSAIDATTALSPAQLALGIVGEHQLPFSLGEVWRVQQGNDNPGGSHNGRTAAFSYDFVRDPNPAGALDRTSLGGIITNVVNDPDPTDGSREGSSVTVKIAPHVFNVYLHNTTDSFAETFLHSDPADVLFLPSTAFPGSWLPVKTQAAVATVGPNARHEHYNARDDGGSIPSAFTNYFVSTDKVNWSYVSVGRPVPGTWVTHRPVAGDIDGDRRADIFAAGVSTWSGIQATLAGIGTQFGAAQTWTSDFSALYASKAGAQTLSGDFDGDGLTDVVATGPGWWLSVPIAISNGDGTFTTRNLVSPGGSSQNFNIYSSQAGAKVVAGDFDNDGRTDLVATGIGWWGTLPIARSLGDGTFSVTNNANSDGTNFNQFSSQAGAKVVSGDFDGDGFTDLAATGVSSWGTTTPIVLSNGPSMSFRLLQTTGGDDFNVFSSQAGVTVLAGDFNGDGRTDLIATGVSWWVSLPIALSNGDGTFTTKNLVDSGGRQFAALASEPGVRYVVGDFDGNGVDDIAAIVSNGIGIAFSKGDGTYDFVARLSNFFDSASQSGATTMSSWK